MRVSGLLLCAALASITVAQAQADTRAEIFDAGIYQLEVVQKEEAPNTATGFHALVKNTKLVEPTTCIPARRGANFGFRYRVVSDAANDPLTLRMIVRYPEGGLRNPATNKVHDRSEVLQPGTIADISLYSGYRFDEDWEVVPGAWVFEIWYNEKLIASQKFEVGPCFRGARSQQKYPWHASGLG